jgi:putative hemolysin
LIATFSAAFGGARIGDILTTWMQTIPALEPVAETLSLVVVVLVITYLSLVLGELVPKRLALANPERWALMAAPAMTLLAKVARPVIALLTFSVDKVLWLLGQRERSTDTVTEEDIVYMVGEGRKSGSVEAGEAQFIRRVFQFTDRPVHTLMTPRTQIIAVSTETPLREILDTFLASGYSRLPVYRDNLDNIVGTLFVKDVMKSVVSEAEFDLMQAMRPPIFVVESARGDDVMLQFRQQGAQIGIVIDEYGQAMGLITLEDLLEELVGEIRDEKDYFEENPFVQREDGSWLVDALEPYDKVCSMVHIPYDGEIEPTTLAGFIADRLEHIPRVGDIVRYRGFAFEVVDMDGMRIDKVLCSHYRS